jgi:hypothetical protein
LRKSSANDRAAPTNPPTIANYMSALIDAGDRRCGVV